MCFRVLTLLVLVAPGMSRGSAEGRPTKPPAAALAALKQEFLRVSDTLDKAYSDAKTDSERKKLLEKFRNNVQSIVSRAVELAREHPKDPVSLEALTWVITGGLGWGPGTEAAFDLIARDHLQSDKLEMVCAVAGIDWDQKAAERFLRTMIEKSPHRTIRGIACLSLARNLKYQAGAARHQKKPDADRLAREAEATYERAAADYGDVCFRDRTVGDRARGALFEMRNLAVGKKAPDIAGEDIDGKKFRLSDYKGKVVLLDFWGNW
jgi:hypothetical protein